MNLKEDTALRQKSKNSSKLLVLIDHEFGIWYISFNLFSEKIELRDRVINEERTHF